MSCTSTHAIKKSRCFIWCRFSRAGVNCGGTRSCSPTIRWRTPLNSANVPMTGDDQPHLTAPGLSAPLFLVVPDRRSPCHSQTSQPQPIVARLVLKLRALPQYRWTGRPGRAAASGLRSEVDAQAELHLPRVVLLAPDYTPLAGLTSARILIQTSARIRRLEVIQDVG
jgi:hypothetical protein